MKYYPERLRKPFLEKDWNNMFCPCCLSGLATDGKDHSYTKHHIYPLRHWKGKDERKEFFILCFSCHNKLEQRLRKEEDKYKNHYFNRACHKPGFEKKRRLPRLPKEWMYPDFVNKFLGYKLLLL